MILLQLSAGQGPVECCKAVGLALKTIEKQCREKGIKLDIVETIATKEKDCFKFPINSLNGFSLYNLWNNYHWYI